MTWEHDRATWGIWEFPIKLRREFGAECRRAGDTICERLEYLVAKDLRERQQKRRREEGEV